MSYGHTFELLYSLKVNDIYTARVIMIGISGSRSNVISFCIVLWTER